jgi:acetyl-CoA carboxylase biotin carboxylase subunit
MIIRKLLIANRGEIVSRIIRTCRDLGIGTVAIYSEADRNAAFLKQADEAFLIGPANPVKSYLNIDALLEAGKSSGADAVHPGYGFLSENASFAEAVKCAGMTWVGPSSDVLKAVESKCYCRHIADGVGVPVNPGTLDPVKSVDEITEFARKHGYPIFLKLDRGGGGKGIEMIEDDSHVKEIFERVSRIGHVAFDSSDCYIEKVLFKPRHIEVQFLGDHDGHYACLGERECSIQRRHQKIIEESPSPVVTENEREMIFDYTMRLASAMGYQGAGTMEFLRSEHGVYYFMEVNARLQVEHPVTEMITGIDIVKNQLLIASGEQLPFTQEQVQRKGHAVEARIYAEDPLSFAPSPGTVRSLRLPTDLADVRIDHALEENGTVPAFYDPLLAKVIAWGSSRAEAVSRLCAALQRFNIEGIKTTIATNFFILKSRDFAEGNFNTSFIKEMFGDIR